MEEPCTAASQSPGPIGVTVHGAGPVAQCDCVRVRSVVCRKIVLLYCGLLRDWKGHVARWIPFSVVMWATKQEVLGHSKAAVVAVNAAQLGA